MLESCWLLQLKLCSRKCPIPDLLHTQPSEVWRRNPMPPVSAHIQQPFCLFSEAAKECKSKHVNCFKIRMTSEVMPEKGSPRQQECPMWNIELWNLRPRFHQTIDSKTENEHVNTVQYKNATLQQFLQRSMIIKFNDWWLLFYRTSGRHE